jgi:hypothetical protein
MTVSCASPSPLALRLLHAVFGVPRTLEPPDVDDLADVVGVVGADVGDGRGVLLDRFVVGSLDELFQFEQHFVELLHSFGPLLCVEGVEGFVVVAVELGRRFAFKFGEGLGVPEQEVVGELSDGMIAFAVGPIGLIGGESCDGYIRRDEPVFIVVSGLKLFEQDAAERGRLLVFFLVLGLGYKRQGKQEYGEDSCHESSKICAAESLHWTTGTLER